MSQAVLFSGSASGADWSAWETVYTTEMMRGVPGLVNLQVKNSHASLAFTGLRIQLKDHPDGEWYTFLADTDFAATDLSNMLFAAASGATAVHLLAAADLANIHLRTNAAWAMRVQVKATAAGSAEVVGTYYPC